MSRYVLEHFFNTARNFHDTAILTDLQKDQIEIIYMKLNKSRELLRRAQLVIPSATQTFSKGPGQWASGVSPHYLVRGEGAWVWDADGNKFLDYVMALGSVTLGYGDPDIAREVSRQIVLGANFSMMHPLEVEVAEKICELVPCAEMVRFGKNGSDATSAMVRAARAFTKRERIAVCGYHGWQDWYIGTTSRKAGVPDCVQELTKSFEYNDSESLEKLLEAHPGEYALVMLEPLSFTFPKRGFLESVRDLAHAHGAILGFDEVVSGFRVHPGGAQALFGVTPDIASFGKGMANGLPLSCVVGRRDIMEIFDNIFFSSTFAGEVVALAAANRFLDIIADGEILEEVAKHGGKLQQQLMTLITDVGLNKQMDCVGHGSHWGLVLRSDTPEEGLLWRSYLIQECIKRGYLFFGSHNPTPAHDTDALEFAMVVYSEVLPLFAERLRKNDMQKQLKGKVIEPIFRVHS